MVIIANVINQLHMIRDLTIDEDEFITIALEGFDPNGDLLTYQITQAPANGNLTGQDNVYLYIPDNNYFGNDSFNFIVYDLNWTSNEATVTITIDPVNDAPAVSNVSYSLSEDSSIEIQLEGFDIENDELLLSIDDTPENGDLLYQGNDIYLYIPDDNYYGNDAFTYYAFDGQLYSNSETINLSIVSVNDPPLSWSLPVNIFEDEIGEFVFPHEDIDTNEDELSIVLLSEPSNGTININGLSGTYTPFADVNGFDSIDFQITDGIDLSEIYQNSYYYYSS